MNLDDQDFYGHTHRRLPKGLIAALLLLVMLILAMAWADSDLAADYESAKIVAQECAKQPELCRTAARPRKKKLDECRSWSPQRPERLT